MLRVPWFRIFAKFIAPPPKMQSSSLIPHNHNHYHRLFDKPSICIQLCAMKLKYLFTDLYINPVFAPSTKLSQAVHM